MLLIPETDLLAKRDLFVVEDDFDHYVSGDKWTGGGDTDAPEMVADVPSGVVRVLTTAVDNEETWLHTTQEAFLYQEHKPLVFDFLGYYAEVAGDTSSIFIGFMNDLDTTPFQDDGLGPKADFCGFGFFRKGSTAGIAAGNLTALEAAVWHTIVDNETDFGQLIRPLVANTRFGVQQPIPKQDADNDTLVRLSGMCRPIRLITATVLELEWAFWINDRQVVYERAPMTIANFVVMHGGIAVHAGEAQITSCFADMLSFSQRRINII